ncbi:MAG: hypothetical protein ACOY4N_10170 [Pseudomonadota bacterium]|uniref:Uncharacterized protein n=1 Tax=Sphingobium xenophagum TaxID=121428 RepID=A0A249MPE6_SPHXE|nr:MULTISPECIES: hypothetical protein [Sphingobium]ASY43208.1 hypothetical protein CJD35_01120 [Sphingobium xenophagum]MBG6117330.1 uncharacterized protein HemX [Sphingobium sp. JAI105]OUC55218.1 hypothetical protein CA262_10415 [Sphingobium sp. GW456-12-10-14-TSB1]PSO11148.1 hypothetical protein C7E20_12640 [Sphingobium sp. AEW4]QWT13624.1 hypothetical protein GTV57_13200 [Sphingobium xenophagum]|tara:strand:- start:4838 stop:5119 length:282 start_codon:yes stop_codon:yes gene_type:complete
MGDTPLERDDPPTHFTTTEPSRGSGVVFALVALALILAIGFFYLTNDRRDDRQAEAVTSAAQSVDDAAKLVGDAAKNAADKLRDGNGSKAADQ